MKRYSIIEVIVCVVSNIVIFSVEWCSCSTEPSEGTDGTGQSTHSKIHSIILPQRKSFHTFLQNAFKIRGTHMRKACVVFALNVRCYGDQVQDLLIAEVCIIFFICVIVNFIDKAQIKM